MDEEMKEALAEYVQTIKVNGWEAGEPLIVRAERRFKHFRRWANALGIMLRAEEILEEAGR